MRAMRLFVLGLAVVAAAWFLLGVRQARDISIATNVVSQSGPVTAAQAGKTLDGLESAGTLNPDKQVDVLRAALAARRGDLPRARQILEGVGRVEPMDINAWYLLAQIAGNDPKVEAQALEHVATLHPRVRSS